MTNLMIGREMPEDQSRMDPGTNCGIVELIILYIEGKDREQNT